MPERRKLVSGLLVLTGLSALLIVPPLVNLFNQPISHFGLPQIVIYLFAVWLLMIVGTAVLTRSLPRNDTSREPGEDDS